jgi:translation initiation factor IF-1
MLAKLETKIVKSRVFPKSTIILDGNFIIVGEVTDKTVTYTDDEGKRKRINKDEAEQNIVKFTVKTDKAVFDLSYSSYEIATELFKENNRITSITVEGRTNQVKTRAIVGSTIRLHCMDLVDKYELFDKDNRYGTIIEKTDNRKFKIELRNNNKVGNIVANRNQFILVNEKDTKVFFELSCKKCNR